MASETYAPSHVPILSCEAFFFYAFCGAGTGPTSMRVLPAHYIHQSSPMCILLSLQCHALCGVDTGPRSVRALRTVSSTAPELRLSRATASLCSIFSTLCLFTATIWSPRFNLPSAAAAPDANTVLT